MPPAMRQRWRCAAAAGVAPAALMTAVLLLLAWALPGSALVQERLLAHERLRRRLSSRSAAKDTPPAAVPPPDPMQLSFKSDMVTPMITNGTSVSWKERFPYLVGVSTPTANCTGFLIQSDVVLTAASCFDFGVTKDYAFAQELGVYWVGSTSGTQSPFFPNKTEELQQLKVKSAIIHPLYNPNNFEFDIAVLMLVECIEPDNQQFDKILASIKDDTDAKFDYSSNYNLAVPGWGQTAADGPRSQGLLATNVSYGGGKVKECNPSDDLQFCAKGASTTSDACIGDAGSPLIYNTVETDNPLAGNYKDDRLIGIVSGPKSCGKSAVLYTNTTFFWEWLNSFVFNTKICPTFFANFEPKCYNAWISLEPTNPLGGCHSTLVQKDTMYFSSGDGVYSNQKITWTRKSNVNSTEPPKLGGGGGGGGDQTDPISNFYVIGAGEAYGFVISIDQGLLCSGSVRVFPCRPVCKDLKRTVDAAQLTDPNGTCVTTVKAGLISPSDFWDLNTVARGAQYSILYRLRAAQDPEKLVIRSEDTWAKFSVGTHQLQGEIYYKDMKTNKSETCVLRVTDATKMGAPSAVAGATCFYRKSARDSTVAIPLNKIASLPDGPRCISTGNATRPTQRLVATQCDPGSTRGGRTICRPQNPALTQDNFDPVGAVTVDMRSARAAQSLTVSIQTWDPNGPVGGGGGPTPMLAVNVTLYKSAAVGRRKDSACVPVTREWSKGP